MDETKKKVGDASSAYSGGILIQAHAQPRELFITTLNALNLPSGRLA